MKKVNSSPTIKDVAREAGVALGTVSKVVNGLSVREPYKHKVEDAIRKLDYHVNSYAQGLKSNRTDTVALLVPNLWDPFFSILTHHINRELQARRCRMFLCTTDFNPDLEQEYVTMLQNNKVDGIIGLTYNPQLEVPEGIPFVSIDRSMGPHIPCVASDNFQGGQMAAEKLADLGCTNVALPCRNTPRQSPPRLYFPHAQLECLRWSPDQDKISPLLPPRSSSTANSEGFPLNDSTGTASP